MMQIADLMRLGNLVLSPMAGITDAPMRQIASQCGADYAIGEMISSDIALWDTKKTRLRLNHDTNQPWVVQIAGASPDVIADAAKRCQEIGVDILEINMGCPAKKVCNVLAGSALLKDEALVASILSAAVDAVNIPVILKTRLGWNNNNENIVNISKIAEDSGIQSLTIHGRTREDMYNGNARYDLIAKVKQLVTIPVFANGDITSPEIALYVLEYTNVNGLYIGRGALGRPWIFQQIKDYLQYGKYVEPSIHDIVRIIKSHLLLIYEHYGEIMGTRIARKHMKWYLQNLFTNDKSIYQAMLDKFSISESKHEQLALITQFFAVVSVIKS